MKSNVVLVDTEDNVLGECNKLEAHINGKLHRAFSIFIFNSEKKLLIQKRANHKYHSGGLWSNSCCSHPNINETTLSAAHKRLQDELGFDCELTERGSFIYKVHLDNDLYENEYDHIIIGKYNGEIKCNPDEVQEFKWIDMTDIQNEIKNHPEKFTFWFKKILEINSNILSFNTKNL